MNRSGLVVFAVGALALLGGCQTRIIGIQEKFRAGDLEGAAKSIDEYAKKHDEGTPQTTLAYIEQGSMLRVVERYADSDAAFEKAEGQFDFFDGKNGNGLGNETQALLTTPDRIPYQGFDYDRVLVACYRSLNAIALGHPEDARQHLFRAMQRQQEVLENNRKRIEEAEKVREKAREEGADVERSLQSEELMQAQRERYGNLDAFEAYEGFAVPYADMIAAVYFMGTASDTSDFDRARNLMRRVSGMLPENESLRADLDLADRLAAGEARLPDMTYVFFETGVGPYRKQFKITLPIFLVNNAVDTVSIAVPYLEYVDQYTPAMQATWPEGLVTTSLLMDTDRVVSAEFKERLPGLITRMIVSATLKSAAQYGVNEATKSDDVVNILARVGTSVWAIATNEADLRTWATLPKQVQYARFETPASGSATLIVGAHTGSVQLEPDATNLVIVRSVRPEVPPIISSYTLRPEGSLR
ncbi:MAG: hypothetical protein RBS39_08440 [Phycisphaerales bacterium]|jgi:hypothetical protein|nr:hypothetical protein [Phycisphaerales bacterium]